MVEFRIDGNQFQPEQPENKPVKQQSKLKKSPVFGGEVPPGETPMKPLYAMPIGTFPAKPKKPISFDPPTKPAPMPQPMPTFVVEPTARPIPTIPAIPVPIPQPTEQAPKLRAKAVDTELLAKRGASFEKNNPNGKAQFVVGDEDGEVEITGIDKEKPDTITIKDNTNGSHNKFVYRKLTDVEIIAGRTFDGREISKDQFKEGETYYILVSAENKDGENIRSNNDVEIYKLNYSKNEEDNTVNYNLEQREGMDGSGKSSIDYNKRKS